MPNNIRQRISRTIRRTLKKISVRSSKKPIVSSLNKQTPRNDDYIDLSECYSKDSGIYLDSTDILQSTKLFADDSSIFSNLSAILPVTKQRMECCRCQCHHYINEGELSGGRIQYGQKIYPFIF